VLKPSPVLLEMCTHSDLPSVQKIGQPTSFSAHPLTASSNTSRHLAEFHMVEPELAFADLEVSCSAPLSPPSLSNTESGCDEQCGEVSQTCCGLCSPGQPIALSLSRLLLSSTDLSRGLGLLHSALRHHSPHSTSEAGPGTLRKDFLR
jgi:hypothetical protein